ncbi:MAG: arginine repressor [Clostridia bacterium]|nr:arginine repressor [Clostridia bacterium]
MKNDRQLKILNIISEKEIHTQEELIAALREKGFAATQATVSRDIKELHLQKKPCEGGGTCYAPTSQAAPEKEIWNEKYRKVLSEVMISAVPACNLVVIKTLSGTASAAAAALEASEPADIIGTLAGDDTLLVIFGGEKPAFRFARMIEQNYLQEKAENQEDEE